MKFRKKPVVIEAIQWTGKNLVEISTFVRGHLTFFPDKLEIHTLEGKMTAPVGHWIICGVKGEYYPCDPDIFKETYEQVED